MAVDHYAELLLIEMSRAQREVLEPPEDTGEKYDANGEIVVDT